MLAFQNALPSPFCFSQLKKKKNCCTLLLFSLFFALSSYLVEKYYWLTLFACQPILLQCCFMHAFLIRFLGNISQVKNLAFSSTRDFWERGHVVMGSRSVRLLCFCEHISLTLAKGGPFFDCKMHLTLACCRRERFCLCFDCKGKREEMIAS